MQEFRDLRAKVSVETDAVLDTISRATGRDRSEIVREVLHAWAQRKIHESSLLQRRLVAEGIQGPPEGAPGKAQ